jgi:hypothetical protein
VRTATGAGIGVIIAVVALTRVGVGVPGQVIGQQISSGLGVAGVGRGHFGSGHDLGIGVHRDVTPVAVEATRGGLVPVARLRVHGADHPILGDPARDAEHPVGVAVEVLADHGGQQLGGLVHLGGQLPPIQRLSPAPSQQPREHPWAARAMGLADRRPLPEPAEAKTSAYVP